MNPRYDGSDCPDCGAFNPDEEVAELYFARRKLGEWLADFPLRSHDFREGSGFFLLWLYAGLQKIVEVKAATETAAIHEALEKVKA